MITHPQPMAAIFALFSVTPAATIPALEGVYGQLLAAFILPSDLPTRLEQYVQALHHTIVTMPTATPEERLEANFLSDVRDALMTPESQRGVALLDVVGCYAEPG